MLELRATLSNPLVKTCIILLLMIAVLVVTLAIGMSR